MKTTAVPQDVALDLDLTQEEIDLMKEQFYILDRQKTGSINSIELPSLFDAVGEYLNQEKLQQLQKYAEDKGGSRKLDINLALRVWSYLKELNLKDEEEEIDFDILNAFVAMGGSPDKKGVIRKQKLVDIIKIQFGLTIDIEAMLEEAGLDAYEDLTFSNFTNLLESGESQRASRICSIFSQASAA